MTSIAVHGLTTQNLWAPALQFESDPSFGLYINLSKCDLYWPSGESSFPNFHPAIKRINPKNDGLDLLFGDLHSFMMPFCLFSLIK